ncbi:MAG: flagellar basal body P-ring formation chaperone FlgA [Planctomycetaceae bacterium]|nr:flagellar basal body P-ring formation chaperone FlgA [Planctomycetaceae bacterium]
MNFMALCLVALAAGEPSRDVRIHLPREISVACRQLTLGDVGVVSCDNATLREALRALPLGRSPLAQEVLTIEQALVRSRVACSNLQTGQVTVTGADRVSVRRKEQVIKADTLVEQARAFLAQLPELGTWTWRVSTRPQDLTLPSSESLKYQARLDSYAAGLAHLRVAVSGPQGDLAEIEVVFKRIFTVRRWVAVRDIAAGEALTQENLRIEEQEVSAAVEAYVPPATALASQPIAKGTAIRSSLVRQAKPEVLVRRNQAVTMRIVGEGFTVSAMGQALEDGYEGQYIKVRNVDSKRIVSGIVLADASVQPQTSEVRR